jgi:hypothetical protein
MDLRIVSLFSTPEIREPRCFGICLIQMTALCSAGVGGGAEVAAVHPGGRLHPCIHICRSQMLPDQVGN